MKRKIAIVLLMAAGFAVQSCGSYEKCPAYSSVEVASEVSAEGADA